jgi:hypothetical protein
MNGCSSEWPNESNIRWTLGNPFRIKALCHVRPARLPKTATVGRDELDPERSPAPWHCARATPRQRSRTTPWQRHEASSRGAVRGSGLRSRDNPLRRNSRRHSTRRSVFGLDDKPRGNRPEAIEKGAVKRKCTGSITSLSRSLYWRLFTRCGCGGSVAGSKAKAS